uniref:Aspartyl-tRNA synthetase n=1 Tax=Panagrolaimus superbus TaxID=310955 RepID=A0A914YP27_9BILA
MSTDAANIPEAETGTDEKKLSKKELNKLAKQAKKAELKKNSTQGQQENQGVEEEEDISEGKYGNYELIQSSERKTITFTLVNKLDESYDGKMVWIRGRLHTSRVKGKTCFVVIRQQISTVQVAAFAGKDDISKQMIKFIEKVSKESIVDVADCIMHSTRY